VSCRLVGVCVCVCVCVCRPPVGKGEEVGRASSRRAEREREGEGEGEKVEEAGRRGLGVRRSTTQVPAQRLGGTRPLRGDVCGALKSAVCCVLGLVVLREPVQRTGFA
jgi:hypothetical protein